MLKQYLPLAGKPVLAHSIEAVSRSSEIAGITVALAEDDKMFIDSIEAEQLGVNTVIGGRSRAESVLNGLNAIVASHPETEWVLVHDAARPCLPGDCLTRLLERGLNEIDGAILAIPIQDTIKQADKEGRIKATIDRNGLWAAQTPQLFPIQRLKNALQSMLEAGVFPTDEAGAIEYTGGCPLLVMGSTANIKITRPEDLASAERWFAVSQAKEALERQ